MHAYIKAVTYFSKIWITEVIVYLKYSGRISIGIKSMKQRFTMSRLRMLSLPGRHKSNLKSSIAVVNCRRCGLHL